MHIITSPMALKDLVTQWHQQGERIGLTPTMGALHDGHLALIRALTGKASRKIVTLFVNPTQFNNAEDFHLYPRQHEADIALLQKTGEVDALYIPHKENMYPQGFSTKIFVSQFDTMLCGADRPGHFEGVATVVTKLFLQTQADIAAFGEKDYQQLCLIRRLVKDLNIPVEILAVPTQREADGLALSSRNRRLTPEQRRQATQLPAALHACLIDLRHQHPLLEALARCRTTLENAGFVVHYLDLRKEETLEIAEKAEPHTRLFVAASLGNIRLIDNMPVF
ncbi:MAG: pantoate--beta-alanine ligase [Acetobacter sp.]|nr:pantoate--beta-alanine ligase [Acetobacter sp.]